MISLEKAPNSVALEAITDIGERASGLVLPSGAMLPPKYDAHPALQVGFYVMPADDPLYGGLHGAPMWGGVASEEEFGLSTLFITDDIPEDARPHLAAIVGLTAFTNSQRIIRGFLNEANQREPEIEQQIGSAMVAVSRVLEPMYCTSTARQRQEFLKTTGYSVDGHRFAVREQAGEIIFVSDVRNNLHNSIVAAGGLDSKKFQAELPHNFGRRGEHTVAIGAPYALNGIDRVTSAYVTKEPANPAKRHVCYGCHSNITPGSLRVTVRVDTSRSGSSYDHHHLHASCC